MARKTGLSEKTLQRIIMDAGVVYLNYGSTDPDKPQMKLGCTRGGNSFTVSGERRDMPFDGLTGIVQGGARFLGVTAELTVNLIEVSKEILAIAVPGATYGSPTAAKDETGTAVTGENYYKIQRRLEQTIPTLDYFDVAIVAEVSNLKAPVVCGLKNTISGGNLELSFADADESVLAVTFTGTVNPNDPDEEPWYVLWPEKLPVV